MTVSLDDFGDFFETCWNFETFKSQKLHGKYEVLYGKYEVLYGKDEVLWPRQVLYGMDEVFEQRLQQQFSNL